MKGLVIINDKEYISVSRASEITKYSNDYIGQLCRSGKIPAQMQGRVWLVDKDALLAYMEGADQARRTNGLRAARNAQNGKSEPSVEVVQKPKINVKETISVQAASITPPPIAWKITYPEALKYSADTRPLLPELKKKSIPSSITHKPRASAAHKKIKSPIVPARKLTYAAVAIVTITGALTAFAAYPTQTFQALSRCGNDVASMIVSADDRVGHLSDSMASLTWTDIGRPFGSSDRSLAQNVQGAQTASIGSWWSGTSKTIVATIRNWLGITDTPVVKTTPSDDSSIPPSAYDTFLAGNASTSGSIGFVTSGAPSVASSQPSGDTTITQIVVPGTGLTITPSHDDSDLSSQIAYLTSLVQDFQNSQNAENAYLSNNIAGSISNAFRGFSGGGGTTVVSNNTSGSVTSIDASGGTTGLSFTGGPVTSSGVLTLAGILDTSNGGTGVSAAPTYGKLLIGNDSGGYDLVATSTIGLGGSSGTVSSVNASGGTTGLTFTGGPITSSGSLTLGGVLDVLNGGTGWSSVQAGSIPYGNGSSALATTSAGTSGTVLALLNGVPTWTSTTTFASPLTYVGGQVSLGTVDIAHGGTNQIAQIPKSLLWYDGTSITGTSSSPLTVGIIIATTTATSTFQGGIQANALNIVSTLATSTFANGINLSGGCFAVNNTCVGGSSGGGGVTSVTNSDGSLTISPTSGAVIASLNVLNPNSWTGLQQFRSASSTAFSVYNSLAIGGMATTTIVGNNGTSTFSSFISFASASSTATSTLAGINLPYGGCVAVGGICLTSNTGTVTSVTGNNGLSGSVTSSGTIGLDLTKEVAGSLQIWNGTQFQATGTPSLTVGYIIATTTKASQLPYASTTALTSSGSAYLATAGGLVGIGTNSPKAKLNVSGGGIEVDNNQGISFDDNGGNPNGRLYSDSSNTVTLQANTAFADLRLYTNAGNMHFDAGSNTDSALLLANGNFILSNNLGIGTSSPSRSLSIQGNELLSGNLSLSSLTATGTIKLLGLSDGCLQTSAGVVTSSGAPCGSGGGSSGSWSTTTSSVAGRFINYPNNSSDIVNIGSNSTTTGKFWFDPNTQTAYIGGVLGIGTTSPGSLLSIGNTNGINLSTATSTFSSTGGINLTSGCFAIHGICVSGNGGSSGQSFAYPFSLAGNATSTLTQFNGGLTAYASSTIGNGLGTGGLTVNGNATTTGNAYFAANLAIGAQSSFSPFTVIGSGAALTPFDTGSNLPTTFITTGGTQYSAEFSGTDANGVMISTHSSSAPTFLQFDNIANNQIWTTMADSNDDFTVRQGNTSGTPRIMILNNGKVGISTSTPLSTLDVYDPVESRLFVDNLTSALSLVAVGGVNYIQSGQTTSSGSAADLSFGPMQSAASWLYLKNSNGFVGIGTTSPSSNLSVQGNELLSGNLSLANLTATGTITANILNTSNLNVTNTGTTTFNGDILARGISAWQYLNVPYIQATSTTASSFLYASTTGITSQIASTSNLFVSSLTSGRLPFTTTSGQITDSANLTFNGTVFSVNTSLFRLTTLGSLGLSTTTPGTILSVGGVANFAPTGSTLYSWLNAPYFVATSSIASILPYASSTVLTSSGSAYFATAGGSVGIGTSSPSSLLSIQGNALFSGNLALANLTATGTAYFGGNVGIGTSSPYASLSVAGASGVVANIFNATNTQATSTFAGGVTFSNNSLESYSSGLTAISNLETGNLNFDTNAGNVSWTDLPVTSAAPVNTVESYSAMIGGQTLLSLYSVSDGTGATKSRGVGIGTSTPYSTLTVWASSTPANIFEVVSAASSTLAVVKANGNFGVGTSSPSSLLSIQGSALFSGDLSLANLNATGTVTAANLTVSNITGSPTFNGTGTTTFNGDILARGISAWQYLNVPYIQATSTKASSFLYASTTAFTSTGSAYLGTNGSSVGIGTTSPSSLFALAIQGNSLVSGNLSIATLTATGTAYFGGNVGIGTTSPYAALSVAGASGVVANIFNATNTVATSTFAGGLSVGNGILNADFSSGQTSIASLVTGAMNFDTNAGVVSWTDLPVTTTATAGTLESYSAQIDTQPLLTLYSQSDGLGGTRARRVGIGTTTPYSTLTVWASTTPDNIFEAVSAASSTLAVIKSTGYFGIGTTSPWALFSVNPSAGNLNPQLVVGSSTASSLIVTASGNVGIGTTTPWRNLSLNGTLSLSANLTSNSTTGVDDAVCIDPNTFEVIRSTGGSCIGSSARFKQNINSLTSDSGLSEVMSLRPVSFDYKTGTWGTQVGFIAEEVQQIDPRLVVLDDNGQPYTVRYENITAVLAKAIQELDTNLTTLSSRTDALEARVSALEATAAVNGTASTTALASNPTFISSVASAVNNLLSSSTEWIVSKLTAKIIITDRVEAQTAAVTKGLEMTDQATGSIYCVSIQNGDFSKRLGSCDSPQATSTPAGDTTAPVITLNGSSDFELNVGQVFLDPGVTVTDNIDPHPTLVTFLDGAQLSQFTLDTSVPSTHTITYVATDAARNKASTTRTVNVNAGTVVISPSTPLNPPVDPGSTGTTTATSTPPDNGGSDASSTPPVITPPADPVSTGSTTPVITGTSTPPVSNPDTSGTVGTTTNP